MDIPLSDGAKTHENDMTTEELYETLASLFRYVFLDFDVATSYKNRVTASARTQRLSSVVRKAVQKVKDSNAPGLEHMLGSIVSSITGEKSPLPGFGKELVRRLLEGGKSVEDVVAALVPTQAATTVPQAQSVRCLARVHLG